MHLTTQFLANEEKMVIATSKVEALEAEASGLRKDLIAVMDAYNASKEQVKVLAEQLEAEKLLAKQKDELLATANQKMKAAVAKAVLAFQTTEEYNTILFQWYFKDFELLRRYLLKHGPGTDLENLDFEAVNKEIEADEAAQAAQASGEDPPVVDKGGDDAPLTWSGFTFEDASLFFFFWVPCMFFGLSYEQYFCVWYVLVFLNNWRPFMYDMWVGIFLIRS